MRIFYANRVKEQQLRIDNDKIVAYQVNLMITFAAETCAQCAGTGKRAISLSYIVQRMPPVETVKTLAKTAA